MEPDEDSVFADILMKSVFNDNRTESYAINDTESYVLQDTSTENSELNATVLPPYYAYANETNLTEAMATVFNTYPTGLLEFAVASCVLFIIVGVPGNLLTVLALLKTPNLRNATTAFIVNLCLADAFLCLSSLPLAASNFLRKEWIHGDTLCILNPMFRYTNVAVSLLTVLAITINRYVLICHPNMYNKIYTKWKIALMIALLWVTAVSLLLPTFLGQWGRFGYDPMVGTCTILRVNGRSSKTFIYILCFALPTLVFLICYTRIYFVVRKSTRKFYGVNPTKNKIEAKNKIDLRLLKIVAVIYGTFAICFIPVAVVKITMMEDDLPVINVLGYLGVFVSACINPLIYVVMSEEYRRAYTNLFNCC